MSDERIASLIEAVKLVQKGKFDVKVPVEGDDQIAQLARSFGDLADFAKRKFEETHLVSVITQKVNSGIGLDEVLNYAFDRFNEFIPYDRIGFSLIEENGKTVRARWAKTRAQEVVLGKGYSESLGNTSLQKIIETGQPRILNDLEKYALEHPASDSTRKVVAEGMRSSLTCPLIVLGKPVGFMFFSSMQKNTYKDVHLDIFLQIAGEFSMIVEKGRLYDELLQKNEELRKLDELKSNFVSSVSHELRTPLTIIKEGINQILDGILGPVVEKQKRSLEMVNRSCERLMVIINDLLDISKLEAKKVRLNKEFVDIVVLLNDLVLLFEGRVKQKGLTLNLQCPCDSVKIEIDSGRITQVFTNFIGNSLKFTQSGSITVGFAEEIDSVRFWISDTGCGISEDDLKKVFKRFEQFGREDGAGAHGTGLGLSICKEIIHLHGGEVWMQSVLGEGTTVSFSLPKFSSKKYSRKVIEETFEEATQQSLPLAVLTISIDGKEALIKNHDQKWVTSFLHSFEDWIWKSLRQKSDRVVRSGYDFYVTLFLGKKEAFSVAERIQHTINLQMLESEFSKEKIRIGFQAVNYPYDVNSLKELIANVGLDESTQ